MLGTDVAGGLLNVWMLPNGCPSSNQCWLTVGVQHTCQRHLVTASASLPSPPPPPFAHLYPIPLAALRSSPHLLRDELVGDEMGAGFRNVLVLTVWSSGRGPRGTPFFRHLVLVTSFLLPLLGGGMAMREGGKGMVLCAVERGQTRLLMAYRRFRGLGGCLPGDVRRA